MQMNKKQEMARTSVLFGLTEGLTDEEMDALDNRLYWDWPQSLKDKTGALGRLVENEDRMAQEAASSPSPAK